MYVYLQSDNEQPIKVEVKDQSKLDQYIKKGSITIKGKNYRILSDDFKTAIEVFYPVSNPNKEVWSEYHKLKEKVKHFKKTGIWLNN